MSGRFIGQNVEATIIIEGEKEEFYAHVGNLFRVGGTVTKMPMMEMMEMMMSVKSMTHPGYPYRLKCLEVEDSLELAYASVEFKLKVVPWDILEMMKIKISPTSWKYRLMLTEVVVEGSAILFKTENVPDVLGKR